MPELCKQGKYLSLRWSKQHFELLQRVRASLRVHKVEWNPGSEQGGLAYAFCQDRSAGPWSLRLCRTGLVQKTKSVPALLSVAP